MKIDFHTHGKLAKKLPFSSQYTDWLFAEAKEAGLDAICLTEHFNTLGFQEVYEYIKNNYEQDGDTFLANGLRIFPGMEVDIAEGGHILVIGKMEDILVLNNSLKDYMEKGSFLPFEQLLTLLDTYPVIVGAAHPFREGSKIPTLPTYLLEQLDFIDLNGKDMAQDCDKNQQLITSFCEELKLPYVAGSDTHQANQYGCIVTCFDKGCRTVEDLKKEMNQQRYHIEISKFIKVQVKAAGRLKKALKTIHALGGDYVEVLINS